MNSVDVLWTFSRRISHNTHHCFCNFILSAKEWNGVLITLTHLLSIGARHDAHTLQNHLRWWSECFSICIIELCHGFACVLNVLTLVLPHRDNICIIEKNIRSHEHRVIEESRTRLDAFCNFVFICMRLHEKRNCYEAFKHPCKFSMFWYI